jgi:fatty acid desaturase
MAQSLAELECFDRDKLFDRQGRSFRDFRRGLKPRYVRVWRDIFFGHLALVAACATLVLLDSRYPSAWPLLALAGAFPIAYFIAFVSLFFHEAAHYNLAAARRTNDVLANLFVGSLTGQSIKAYRIVHFDHHRLLGTHEDTEHSYFDALNMRFVVESLVGIRLVRVVLSRRAHVGARAKDVRSTAAETRRMLLVGLGVNVAVMAAAAWAHSWALFFAWPFGMLVVHPAINSLRQLLEHRRYEAKSDVDYNVIDQGVMTRMFGSGPLASTLGGAGFNRHLLHHWDPQLSYTRFAELERFLLETEAADAVRSVSTTYARAFFTLLKAP